MTPELKDLLLRLMESYFHCRHAVYNCNCTKEARTAVNILRLIEATEPKP